MADFIERSLENFHAVHSLDAYMVGHKGFIAGGCFKNIFDHSKIKDVDIFFEGQEDWAAACNYFRNNESFVFSYENDKVEAYKNKHTNVRVELIRHVFGTPEQIISNFDFTITKFAYFKREVANEDAEADTTTEYRVVHHADFFEHLQMKRLVIDDRLVKPISTFERSYKYRDYGYRMCRESKVRLLTAIKLTEFTDADLVQSLYDGMD